MTKKKTEAPPAAVDAPKLQGGHERFVVVEVHRSELKNAPYNPRVLSEEAKKRLSAGVKEHGMLAPVTWNAVTGNIVGGHQRIKILDALNGTADYWLKVARVEMTESQEKEANLLLNAEEAQGEWEL